MRYIAAAWLLSLVVLALLSSSDLWVKKPHCAVYTYGYSAEVGCQDKPAIDPPSKNCYVMDTTTATSEHPAQFESTDCTDPRMHASN